MLLCQVIIIKSFGHDTIDRYPLWKGKIERLLIFSNRVFEALSQVSPDSDTESSVKRNIKASKKHTFQQIIEKIDNNTLNSYEPSNISYAFDSDLWRWRRMKEWFAEHNQEEDPNLLKNNILKYTLGE